MVGDRLGGVVTEDNRVGYHVDQAVSEDKVDALGIRATFPAGDFAVDGVLAVGVRTPTARTPSTAKSPAGKVARMPSASTLSSLTAWSTWYPTRLSSVTTPPRRSPTTAACC